MSLIIVTMTSWTKRIGNVKKVVESIMNNTMKPDRLYLNLSLTEFHGIELPEDLVEYFNSDERLIINWVDGENTKSMKKVFPILGYLDDDDIIINLDDDALLPTNFIECRYNDFKIKNTPITSCNNPKFHFIDKSLEIWSCGAGSLFQKKMLKGYEKFINNTLIYTYNDDWCYSTLLWLNGYKFTPCSSYFMQNGSVDNNGTKLKKYNDIEPMGKKHIYVDGTCMYNILEKRIMDLFGVGFKDSFGILNDKHDCVMVYGKSCIDSQEMTCGDYLEMEYVIASLKKYCSSWVGRIFIVGSEPPERVKKDVIHIPCDNPYTHCKDANIIHKLRYACENIQDLSDDFLMISDDQIVTKESSWEDMKPRIVKKFDDWSVDKWDKYSKVNMWHTQLYNTLKLFPKDKSCFWEPHIWSPINKQKFLEMCDKYNYEHKTDCIILSLYYNFINQDIVNGFDHHYMGNSKETVIKWLNNNKITNIPRHLAWTDTAFDEKRFRDMLDIIVGFKKCKNTMVKSSGSSVKSSGSSMLQKLREGIKNGTIVKEYKQDGTYIWKKVRK